MQHTTNDCEKIVCVRAAWKIVDFYCLFLSVSVCFSFLSVTQARPLPPLTASHVPFARTQAQAKGKILSFHFILKFQMKFLFYIPFPFRFVVLSFVINIYSIILCACVFVIACTRDAPTHAHSRHTQWASVTVNVHKNRAENNIAFVSESMQPEIITSKDLDVGAGVCVRVWFLSAHKNPFKVLPNDGLRSTGVRICCYR